MVRKPMQHMSPREVAARLSVTETTLSRWRAEGKGPPWVKIGGRHRYVREGFEAWLESRPSGGEGAV